MKKAKFTVSLPVVVKKKNAMWISSCPCLDVISQGGTEEEAKKKSERESEKAKKKVEEEAKKKQKETPKEEKILEKKQDNK